jgi:hypothetical protein
MLNETHDTRAELLASPLRPTINLRYQVMTEERLHAAIEMGCGQGFDEEYWPWIRVRRRLSSRASNLFLLCTCVHRRQLHLLSGLEAKCALLASWLGARQIREQYPLWPHQHLHPNAGRWTQPNCIWAPGLLNIARDAGIRHGVYPGTNVPYVATADFLLDAPSDRSCKLVLIAAKPFDQLSATNSRTKRIYERLELQRRYANAVGARYFEFNGNEATDMLYANLDWLMPRHSQLKQLDSSIDLQRFAAKFGQYCFTESIKSSKKRAAVSLAIADDAQINRYFFLTLWLGLVNVDLRAPLIIDRPLSRDLDGFKQLLSERFFGQKQVSKP